MVEVKSRHLGIIKRLFEVLTKRGEVIGTQEMARKLQEYFPQYRDAPLDDLEMVVTTSIYS